MGFTYNPQRKRNMYDPESEKLFRLSRSKVELFISCPHCFYLDRRLGVSHPPGFPFNLNSAVDRLLKKEFDIYRANKVAHPLFEKYGIRAIPFSHALLEKWRDALHGGIEFSLPNTNLLLCGGIDDLWINDNGELIIVDYKATSKNEAVSIDAEWQMGYKRQMEFYAWLFSRNGFSVSHVGYFVYCNGLANRDRFDQKLEFDISILPHTLNYSWVERTVYDIYSCLKGPKPPARNPTCQYCAYVGALSAHN